MRHFLKFILIVLLQWTITACSGTGFSFPQTVTGFQSPLPAPGNINYILTGYPQSLTLVDKDLWQVVKQVDLPDSWANSISIDPLGRIWIGYAGGHGWSDNRMQIFAPDGNLIRTLLPCGNPDSGVHFTQGKALIVCNENGFYAEIAVLNLTNFSVERRIRLDWPDGPYTVYGSESANGFAFIFGIAQDKNPQWDSSYTGVTLLNLDTEEIYKFVPSFPHTKINESVYYEGQYYLFNAASWRSTRDNPTDITVIQAGNPPVVTTMAAPVSSPAFGVSVGPLLYTYHNPTHRQIHNTSPDRAMVRLNLETGESQIWELPDNWDASDMAIIDGKIVLAFSGNSRMLTSVSEAGLYEFDPKDGQLHLLVAIPKAARIAVPK